MSERAGKDADRAPHDAYFTPPYCLRAYLPVLVGQIAHEEQSNRVDLSGLDVLEPACGEGSLMRGMVEAGADPKRMRGIDIVDYGTNVVADFTAIDTTRLKYRFDLILSNPPFKLAQPFIEKGLELLKPNGVLVYLLRVNYLASQKRNAWMRENVPDIAILPKRPSFAGDGRTDGTEYAFFSWRANRRPGRGEVRVLNVEDCV